MSDLMVTFMISSGLRVPIPEIPIPALAVPYAAPTAENQTIINGQ